MKISADPGALKRTQWYEYAIRFVFGGTITVIAGLIAKQYGPVIGGLFLAFPAIFPASVTLVECHEAKKREKDGRSYEQRAIDASGIDSAGAALGSIGLMAFGAVVWWLAAQHSAWLTLFCAAVAWFGVSVAVWFAREKV